jgi:UDP-N-acetylmuramyl pentapeptide synthase
MVHGVLRVRLAVARRRLRGAAVVGITGSVGKTSTKNLLAAILSARGGVACSRGSWNGPLDVAAVLVGAPRGTAACVVEMAASKPGMLDVTLRIARPGIGIVTHVLTDHAAAFRTLDATAAEKGKLVAALPPDGVAVLNADDPRVLAMAARCAGRVLTYGCSEGADLRAVDVVGDWPDRLAFTLLHEGSAFPVRTRMVGRHWVHVALAALGGSVAAGVPLADAVAAVQGAEAAFGRLTPFDAGGVTFLRDDFKGAESSYGPAIEQLRAARAPRKVAVLGTMRHALDPSAAYRDVLARVADAADQVVVVGPEAAAALAGGDLPDPARVRLVPGVAEARDVLRGLLRPGDLVLLKGSMEKDHLARLALDRIEPVACWRTACGRKTLCDACELLRAPERSAP